MPNSLTSSNLEQILTFSVKPHVVFFFSLNTNTPYFVPVPAPPKAFIILKQMATCLFIIGIRHCHFLHYHVISIGAGS